MCRLLCRINSSTHRVLADKADENNNIVCFKFKKYIFPKSGDKTKSHRWKFNYGFARKEEE